MKLKDNSAQEIDTALYQLEQRLKSNIRLTDVENSNASSAKINAVDKKLTEEVKDRQSADEKLQDNINKEIADRQEADAAIENAKQDKLIAGNNIQIDGNVISATSKEYTAEAPVKVTDGTISLDTVPIAKGGTGVTTQADINKAFINNLELGNSDVTDGTEFVSSYTSDKGFADPSGLNKPYKRQFIKVWNYINNKISSVLGLTSAKVSSYDSHLTNKDNPHSVTKSQVGLGSVVNTGDSATPVSGGTTKFTTGGAYTELNKKVDKDLANATGTLSVANGGTGKTTAQDAANAFINSLTTGESVPEDNDYYVAQYAGGGTTTTTYHRRPVSKLWEYIKGKISSVLGLTKDNYGGKASMAGTADKATNDGNGNNIVNTYALKSNLQYTKSININKVDGSSNTMYYLIAETPDTDFVGNIDSLFVNGSDFMNRMFEGTIRTRGVNIVYNYGKSNLPIELYKQTDGTIYVYWLVSDAYNKVALNIVATMYITIYGGNLSPVTPTGSKMTLTEYDYKSYGTLPIGRGGTGVTTQADINKAFIGNLDVGNSDVTDGTEFVSSYTSDKGFAETAEGALNKPYKRQFIKVWNYINNKISSVLGLTKDNYGGKAAQSGFLDNYSSTRLTSLNIVPKDASEYGGMRKDVATSSVTDSSYPGQDGHVLTMFWDNTNRFDSQLYISNDGNHPGVKVRHKLNQTDYGAWTDIITSNNIGSQTVAKAGTANTAGTADYAKRLKTFASWKDPYVYDATNGSRHYVFKITMSSYFNSILIQIYGDINYAFSRKYILGLWHSRNDWGYNVSVTDLGGTKYNGLRVWLGNDGNVYLQADVEWTSRISFSYLEDITDITIEKIGTSKVGSNKDIDGNVLFTPLTDPIIDCGAIRGASDLSSASKVAQRLNADLFTGNLKGNVTGNKLTIQSATVNSNSYTDTNPKLEFKNDDGSQNISLTFTDFDAVQAPASLTLNGNQGNEYFIAPNIKATTGFTGNLKGNVTGNVTGNVSGSSGSASKLTTARTAYVALGNANTTTSIDWSRDTTIPVDGVLSVENGGTGCNTAENAANSLISNLSASDGVPVDTDYFISQHVNGGPFVPAYNRRPISKLWEYIKGKILQEGEDFGYNHIVHDDASLLEWANCTDGHMTKVLVKSGTYNMTKGVNLTNAGTGYVFAENGAVINSKVPIAFTASSGKTTIHNLKVVCGPSSDNTCAFSASDILNLILYDCEASYATNTEAVNRQLFSHCTCYNCHYNFTNSSSNSSITLKVFYQCYCYNCICKQTIAANSSTGIVFGDDSYFFMECVCVSCDAELTTLRNIKAATTDFTCYYNCWDRCVGCISTINVNSNALTVYSTLYGFLRCQHMSSCKEVHTVGYSNIKGVVQCIYVSSTSAVSGESNTNVGNSCDI